MTEEQFWKSNPAKISVYEEVYKHKMNMQNQRIHTWVGTYGLNALFTAISGVLNGKKSQAKYMKEPIQMFPLTEEEKEVKKQQEINKFIMWAKSAERKYNGKEDKDG